MARKSIQSYVLVRAVKVLGGETRAAKLIGVSQPKLGFYLDDLLHIPEAVFVRVVDLLVENEIDRLSEEAKGQWSASNGCSGRPARNGKREEKRERQ